MKAIKLILLLGILSLPMALSAQSREEKLEEYKRRRKQGIENVKQTRREGVELYKQRANEYYAERMRRRWEYFELRSARIIPPSPDPIVPPSVTPGTRPGAPREVVPDLSHSPKLPPVIPPVPAPVKPALPKGLPESICRIDFYGSQVDVAFDPTMLPLQLMGSDERSVTDVWSDLADGRANRWLYSCMEAKERFGLCDWAYIKFTEKAARALVADANQATLLQGFTLIQSGYAIRLGRCGERLCLLMPSAYPIYNYKYLVLDDWHYYVLLDSVDSGIYVFNSIFPDEHLPSSQITLPTLAYMPSGSKHFSSNAFPGVEVDLNPNFNVIAFYDECPRNSEWELFTRASLDETITSHLYPMLRGKIAGCTEEKAANILINFVQTAFEYKTDGEQFGYERPLYGDEVFFYPYSDCEDRSILFAILVRDLLGLDVALLHFEGHLATAVCFHEDIAGDYLMVEGRKYLICDPTYINASIGMMMPTMEGKLLEIIPL